MAGLRAIGMVFGLLYLIFILTMGIGVPFLARQAEHQMSSRDASAGQSADERSEADRRYDSERRYRDYDYDYEDDQARIYLRDHVNVDSDSARPMVDPNPDHR